MGAAPKPSDVDEMKQAASQQPSSEAGSQASHTSLGGRGRLSVSGTDKTKQQCASHSGRGVGRCFYTDVPKQVTVSHAGSTVAVMARRPHRPAAVKQAAVPCATP